MNIEYSCRIIAWHGRKTEGISNSRQGKDQSSHYSKSQLARLPSGEVHAKKVQEPYQEPKYKYLVQAFFSWRPQIVSSKC